MKARIRELLRATPFQPFVIRMADGEEYRIEHPDFVLAASSDVPQITIEEPDGSMHFLFRPLWSPASSVYLLRIPRRLNGGDSQRENLPTW